MKLLAALAVTVVSVVATTAVTRDGFSSDATGAAFNSAMHAAMEQMARAMEQAPMSGDPDRDFLAMMIPHHEGAVEMARLELIHGTDPLARRLAEEIIASQQTEIEAMRGRLAALQDHPTTDPGRFPALHGARGKVRTDD